MTSTMTREQAQALRAARDTDVRVLSRKSKHELVAIYQSEGGYGGGTWSKQDLMGSILEKRFPMAREHEAIHVLGHGEPWPDCRFCQPEPCIYWWHDGDNRIRRCELAPGHDGMHQSGQAYAG